MKLEDEVRAELGEEAGRPFVTWEEHHRAEGRLDERRALLLRALNTLHGPLARESIARVEAGSADELSRWFERAVKGLPLAQVFAD